MKTIKIVSLLVLMVITSAVVGAKEKEQLKENATEVKTETLSLNGVVLDKLTGETLAGAVVTANGKKLYTDFDGNFSLDNVCNGKCSIKVSLISYQEQTIEVDPASVKQVEIKLKRR